MKSKYLSDLCICETVTQGPYREREKNRKKLIQMLVKLVKSCQTDNFAQKMQNQE